MRKEQQLSNYLKRKVMNKKFYWLAGFAALMMTAACSDDNVTNPNPNPDPDPGTEENVVTLQVLDGASQADRIQMVVPTKAVGGIKKNRLNYVATISNPEHQADNVNWSATSVFVENETGTDHSVFITWHSDRQATSPAMTWGGALDIVSFDEIINDETREKGITIAKTLIPDEKMKFEHVMKAQTGTHETAPLNALFISGTHANKGAVVARVNLYNPNKAELFVLPGSSVNAVAESGGQLIAVTGYKGTYATFAPNADPASYSYNHPDRNGWVTLGQEPNDNFGGKYVTTDEGGKAYILRTDESKAQIIDVKSNLVVVDNMKPLISDRKYSESYDPNTGDWMVDESGTGSTVQGKHVMAIQNGFAYVGSGLNGLRVYNLNNGAEVSQADFTDGGPNTTGLCIDENLLYAATGNGLRVYDMKEDGQLVLYAFEVDEYDENGLPNSNDVPTTEGEEGVEATPGHHSANFVSVMNTQNGDKYIFVAYGQDGVRVYKLMPNVGENVGDKEE